MERAGNIQPAPFLINSYYLSDLHRRRERLFPDQNINNQDHMTQERQQNIIILLLSAIFISLIFIS